MALMSIQKTHFAERDQISILLAVTLFSATLFRFVELPTFAWGVQHILGSPLGFSLGGDWLLTILMTGLVATGTLTIMQSHPLRGAQERLLIFSLITPTAGALLTSLLLIRAASWSAWLATLLAGGVLIGVLVRLSYQAFSPESSSYPSARTMLNIIDYLTGFVILSIMMQKQERALITAPAIFLLSGLLALELLSASGVQWQAVLLFGGIVALLESEMGWILGYWPISSWTAAALLTLGLYISSGIAYQYLLKRLTRHIIVEFAVVTLLMFLLVLWVRP